MNRKHEMQTYVDEDCIYLYNIFDEKNRRKLKNSRSEGRLNIIEKFSKNLNRNRSSKVDNNAFDLKY